MTHTFHLANGSTCKKKFSIKPFNPLPDDWSKLKQIADDILECI